MRPDRPVGSPPLTIAEKQRMIALHREGKSVREIVRATGRS
jgi:hypothetical protein